MKKIYLLAILVLSFATAAISDSGSDIGITPITRDSLPLMPVPTDNKNYYLLQAFTNQTNIVIGDFSAAEKVICLIIDNGSDGTIDLIYEYYPENKQSTRVEKPSTVLFTGYPQIKKEIIEGKVFKSPSRPGFEYTHEMFSLPILEKKIREGRFITKRGHNGRYVRVVDTDVSNSTMADYYFGKETALYNLQFQTRYYKSGSVRLEPAIRYSVFCKATKDEVVREYVERLLKLAKERNM